MMNREREQENIGELARAVDAACICDGRVEQAHIVGPELMVRTSDRRGEPFHHRRDRQRIRIARVGHDAQAAVLRDRA